jgi:Ras-related protein Rab-1A
MSEYDYLFKILLIGDSGVGKSSLLLRFVDDLYYDTYISTIGVDFKIKTLPVENKIIKFQLWDTAGQERFRTITSSYYRGAHGMLIIFDLSDLSSFNNLNYWLSEIDRYCNESVQIYIIGTKKDLINKRQVSAESIDEYIQKINIHNHNRIIKYFEVSSKMNDNVVETFNQFAKDLYDKVSRGEISNTNKYITKQPILLNNPIEIKEKKSRC